MAFTMSMPSAPSDDVKKSLKQLRSWMYRLNENLQYTLSHLDDENFTDDFWRAVKATGGSSESAAATAARLNELNTALETLTGRVDLMQSTQWTPLTMVNSSGWSDSYRPGVCKRGSIVYLKGGIRLSSSLTRRSIVVVSHLPEEMWPCDTVAKAVASDSGTVRLSVSTTGELSVKNAETETIPTTSFISLSIEYAI